MSGISSTLSIAKTAISVQQYGLNITGHNIANVNNPDYSLQNAEHKNRTPALYSGFLFGTGVDMYQIRQSVDQLLEQRLTNELTTQASFEEQESYMRILEGFFDESSATSMNNTLTEFWNSWHDLSNNPMGSTERVAVLESGKQLASSFRSVVVSMDGLTDDITLDISAAVDRVNSLTSQIAKLNGEIMGKEFGRTANDLRDQRNQLMDDLGELIDITTHESPDGSLTVNAANSFTIISDTDTNQLSMTDKGVAWESSSSGMTLITDKIQGGRIGGLLIMRDEVIPKYYAEINQLSRDLIWAMNYQHSQGAGLEYIQNPVVGDYSTDDSRWLTSFEFGDKIDATKDFIMWMEDQTTAATEYTKITMDMDLSESRISDWSGMAPGGVQSKYKLTVLDEGVLGDKEVTQTDGDGLSVVHGSLTTVSVALDGAIVDQTLNIYNGPSGTGIINIKDIGGDAKRSASSIAQALNSVDGVSAYASENSAVFDTSGILDAHDGDEVQFSLYVDGVIQQHSFIVDSTAGNLQEQFEDALLSVTEAVNNINEDQDLFVDGLTITSSSGKTLGVQNFEVLDNAGITLSSFTGFNPGDTLSFDVNGVQVSVDLTGVDTSAAADVALAFYNAVDLVLQDEPFMVENDVSTNSVVIRTSDGSGITLNNVSNLAANPTILITASPSPGTTIPGDNTLTFDGADSVVANSDIVNTDTIAFSGTVVAESTAGVVDKAAVITGTITIELDPGMAVHTTVSGAGSGGLFDSSYAKVGSSILTLGGEGGFSNFDSGDTISFDLDNANISFLIPVGITTDIQLAALLETELVADLTTAGVDQNYQIIRTNSSVSIIKDISLEDPINIENFSDDDGSGSGNDAALSVSTGTGAGINQPENDILDADPTKTYRNFTTSSLYSDKGIIKWERLDMDGISTGASGLLSVEDEGSVTIVENGFDTVLFDISNGSLVAGNVLIVNTDTSGEPDPLDFRITNRANSINDIYQFKVISGGKVGHLPGTNEDPLVIEWSNSVEHGIFTIEGDDPPYTPQSPVEVQVDGMSMKFYDGTLFKDDTFTITIGDTGIPVFQNSAGNPSGEKMSDWHWTIDSFAEQFNRVGVGMKATATIDNRLQFQASDSYYQMENIRYSSENGFDEENVSISIKNWSEIDFNASDLRFERSATGIWGFLNDPTGGTLQIIPQGGDDNGFGVDFTGDGFADLQIDFSDQISGAGYVEFDFNKRDSADIGFAFSDNASSTSGLAAAAGINTFFKGYDAITMEVNGKLNDTRLVAAASIDSVTGEISKGDNTNALAMADVQFQNQEMVSWSYIRGYEAQSSTTNATLDDYFNQMMGSMGIKSRSIKNSREFADLMVHNITEQRNSISSVSLDEEMIKLMKYQHAFSAASKLLTVSDEMLNTLITMI